MGEPAAAILAVDGLVKRYGEQTAVEGISFAIREGEVFGFLGPNGAGKTTTINVLTGLARATSGSVRIAGFDGATEIKKAQRIMGIVPDESNLYDEFDGFENLCFCAALYGMPKAEREKKAQALLAQFGLEEAGKKRFGAFFTDLSGVRWLPALSAAFLIAVTSTLLGLFIAVSVKEIFEAQTFSNFFRFPMIFLCGLFLPVQDLPPVLQPLAYLLPLTYGADILKAAIGHNGQLGLALDFVLLLAFAGGLFAISIRNVQRQWIY